MKRTTVAALIGSGVALVAAQPASAAETAPIYKVTQEGMTAEEGARLAEAYRIPNALQENGAFGYVGEDFAQVPQLQGATGKDESGRRTDSQTLDRRALAFLKPISRTEALERASWLTDLLGKTNLDLNPKVSHAKLTLSDRAGKVTSEHLLDTTVSHDVSLGGLPATGQGAKLRITFGPDGNVTQLSSTLRKLEPAGEEPIIPADQAREACERLYDEGVRQGEPTLGYLLPALGAVETIYPVYTCNPSSETGNQAHRQVPAVEGVGPKATIEGIRRGDEISATAEVGGGAGPYQLRWSSSTTALDEIDGSAISYTRRPRGKEADETLTLEVTDVNGLSATASMGLPAEDAGNKASSFAGGGGFGKLAIGPVDVGIEQTVDEWQCAQDSAIGFKSVMASKGVGTAFDWRGASAWERDFKDTSKGGTDHIYVDNVDAQWYTGHGWPGGFTFKSAIDDTSIVPSDARWGNGDLEWMQLESCQVLADTNGSSDYFSRWGGAVDGLHILNGFHTNAWCIGGGTGGTFAAYLFPRQFLFWTLPALKVRNAWAQMAIDKEPSGVVYRSMGNIGSGWVTNIGDFFWGQGPTGPDISAAGRIGQWAISGTV
jgi:hypothetical protein